MKEGQLPDDQGVEWGFAEYVQRGSSLALRREVSFRSCQFGASFAFGICIAGKISQANTQETEDERMQLEAPHQRNFWMAGIGHDMT